MASFGENLTRLRKARNLKGKQLAAKVGVAPSVVSGWEKNRRGLPETPTLFKLATGLKCSIEDLLTGIDAEYDRAVQDGLYDLREALATIEDPIDPSDEVADLQRFYDLRTVQRLIEEVVRDRDLASRAGAVRAAASALSPIQKHEGLPAPSVQPEPPPQNDAQDRSVSSAAAAITEAVYELRELVNQIRAATAATIAKSGRQAAGARTVAPKKSAHSRKGRG